MTNRGTKLLLKGHKERAELFPKKVENPLPAESSPWRGEKAALHSWGSLPEEV